MTAIGGEVRTDEGATIAGDKNQLSININGEEFFKKIVGAALSGTLDGVIAKRIDLAYQTGERTGMVKVKRMRTVRRSRRGARLGSSPVTAPVVAVVGGGQLARMMTPAATGNIDLVSLRRLNCAGRFENPIDLADPATGPATAETGFGALISAARARMLACDGSIRCRPFAPAPVVSVNESTPPDQVRAEKPVPLRPSSHVSICLAETIGTPRARADAMKVDSVKFEHMDVVELPVPANSFDVVFSNSVIEHVGTVDDQRRAADLAQTWTFRGGSSREDIFRTMSTGFNGTPMPSFLDALTPEQRTASLQRMQNYIDDATHLAKRDGSRTAGHRRHLDVLGAVPAGAVAARAPPPAAAQGQRRAPHLAGAAGPLSSVRAAGSSAIL